MKYGALDFFRNKHEGYKPFTSRAAIKAFENGITPIDFFIYKSTSVKSIEEKPYDFDAIERLLSRKDKDFKTMHFLVKVFSDMVKDRDAERALFGAEGINTIESRYNKEIEILKKKLKRGNPPEMRLRLARLYFELAMINEKQKDIKNFFLRTAYNYLKTTQDGKLFPIANLELLINILIELKLNKQALAMLKNIAISHNHLLAILLAKVEFKNHHYKEVYKILYKLKQDDGSLDDETRKLIEYWTGQHDRAD